jgi:ribosomal protein S18 acetylase RimI-like enzyme
VDIAAVVALANLAFRGAEGWSVEKFIEGDRLTEALLRADIATKPHAILLVCREEGALLGSVWLEPVANDRWYLGLLAVRPDLQARRLGRILLAEAEEYARARGAKRIRMTVVNLREPLIAWYERRGYARTGEIEPFPYDDQRFGRPLRADLHFVALEKAL